MLDHISSLSSPSSLETTSCHLRLLTQELAQSCSTGEQHFILPCHVDYATHKYSQVLCKQKISTIRVLRWQCASQGRIPEHRNLPQLQESVRTFRTVKLFFKVQLVHFRIAQMQWSSTQCLSWLQRRRIRPSKQTTDDPLTSIDKSTVQKSTCTLDRWKTQKRRFEKNSSTS